MSDYLVESLELEATAAHYGVTYEGTLVGFDYHRSVTPEFYDLGDLPRGSRITRLRFIGGDYIPGRGKCYDLSYCHATLPNGEIVHVNNTMPNWSLIPRRAIKGELIAWAREEGVYAIGLGMLDEGNWSILG